MAVSCGSMRFCLPRSFSMEFMTMWYYVIPRRMCVRRENIEFVFSSISFVCLTCAPIFASTCNLIIFQLLDFTIPIRRALVAALLIIYGLFCCYMLFLRWTFIFFSCLTSAWNFNKNFPRALVDARWWTN